MVGADPVKSGLVTSLNRPGGNATGINIFTSVLAVKRLELLRELIPKGGLIGVLVNPDNSNAENDIVDLQAAGRTLNQPLQFEKARTAEEIDTALSRFAAGRTMALLVNTDPFYLGRRAQLAALSLQYTLPAIFSLREHAVAGGLISYGSNLIEGYRQIGEFVGRVLKGSKVAEMPVEQPTKFELVINLKTAKALGLTIPPTMLARSDEVIE
jgi:putative ABC transport system substrate-binding protein